ncbi:hypothetical protein [Jiangella muralis]|uniref:hypothetical protein n=1 Tax=Jiangella muralis TaxID=702383 RepID=UPI00069ED25A|nr:hypothetical protein [Jiangella muralis]
MLGLAIHLASAVGAPLQRGPSNVLLARLRTRRGLKWSMPAMLIGVVYLWAAATVTTVIDRGGPGWLHVLVLLFVWNGLKFLINGPFGVLALARVRKAERRRTRQAASTL